MYINRSVVIRLYAIIAIMVSFTPMANALTKTDVIGQLPEYLPGEVAGEPINEEKKDALAQLLSMNPNVRDADVLSSKLIDQAVHDAFISSDLDFETRKRELVEQVDAFISGNAEAAAVAMQLVVPEAWKAGLCQGDPLSKEGAVCAFSFGDKNTSHEGEVADGPNGTKRKIPSVPTDSSLYTLLTDVMDSCTQSSSTSEAADGGSSPVSSSSDPAPGSDDGVRSGNATAGAKPLCLGSKKAYFWYYKYSCGWFDGCRASGEVAGTIVGEYLATAADNLMAIIPVALRCDTGCIIESVLDYIFDSSQSFSKTVLGNADKRSRTLHLESKMSHEIDISCGVLPAPYTQRPTFTYLQKQQYRPDFDPDVVVKLGTRYQIPRLQSNIFGINVDIDGLLSQNAYPVPSRRYSSQPSNPTWLPKTFGWAWDFSIIEGWAFNLMFAAADDYDSLNVCKSNPYPTGKQKWRFQGLPNSSDYGLPYISWSAGADTGHLLKTCPLQ